jgi:protease-4
MFETVESGEAEPEVARDVFSRIAMRPQILLMRAFEDAQAIMAGPAIQARCLECPTSALPRRPKEAGTLGSWLRSMIVP